jgi:hypothetical protein
MGKSENDGPGGSALLEHAQGPGSNGQTEDDLAGELVSDELTYDPVPPRRSISVRVTCRLHGRGRPLPFPLGDT